MSDDSGSALDPDKIPKRRGLHIRDIKEEAPEPEQTVGSELRAAREAAGKELNEVAAALRIKPEHLNALEAAEYDKLPAKTYVVGFVRQYAQQLGLNANELVERLKVELEGPEPEEEPAARGKAEAPTRRAGPVKTPGGMAGRPAPPVEGASRLPVTSIAIVVILLLVVIFGGWYLTRPSGSNDATADKEAETGSNSAPAVPDESKEDAGQKMPDPPVIPASAQNRAARGGSLTALLPGADRLAAAAGDAEGGQERLNMPDAAALAVPIENRERANAESGSGTPEGEAAAQPGEPAPTEMPQPNLALRTSRSPIPGVPEAVAGDADEAEAAPDEPALEDIEAEGVGGGAAPTEAASPAAPEAQPEPEPRPERGQPPARERAVAEGPTAKSRVTLRVLSSTWVRVEDADGQVIMERDMRSGDSFRAPATKGLYLVTKDAGAIEVLLDGESLGRAGRPRQVLTGLLLAPEQLRQRVAQNTGPALR